MEPYKNGLATESDPESDPEIDPETIPSDTINASEFDPLAQSPETDSAPAEYTAAPSAAAVTAATAMNPTAGAEKRWPGWPGDCVFRLIVPVLKVGSIIGRKGELIKKMCEATRARIRVLDGAAGTSDRIVLISGKEEPEAPLSPAMDAAIRIFKRVYGLSEGVSDANAYGAAGVAFCSVRLLVASTQAISLIGKQGLVIKSIQERTEASVRILSGDEAPLYAATDEKIVELQGEASKVLKALEAVLGHLRKFLVDRSVIPLFEKSHNATIPQDRQGETWSDKSSLHTASQTGIAADYPVSAKRDSYFLDRETQLEPQFPSGLSLYGHDPALSGIRSLGLGRTGAPIVTQMSQTMQIPLSYADHIIGIGGSNIGYIRRTSGAILTVQESRGLPDEITVEIKGTSSQVQMAQQLIQESITSRKDIGLSSYGNLDSGLRSSYSQLGSATSSSLSAQEYGGYGSSNLGGYSSFRF